MTLDLNSSGPISLPLAIPGWAMESIVGGYSPGLRGSAANAAPAITANARLQLAKNFMSCPDFVLEGGS